MLNGAQIDGWQVVTPEPMGACDNPPALLMSQLDGVKLQEALCDRAFSAQSESVARVLAAATPPLCH